VTLGVSACSAGGGSGSSSAGGSGAADTAAVPQATGKVSGSGFSSVRENAGGVADKLGDVAPMTRQVIRTGEVTLQGKDVPQIRDEVGRLVQRLGGYVSSEKSFTDNEGRLVEDRLVLRVPSSAYDDVLTGFDGIGTVLSPTTKSEDVTTEVIDVNARVQTAEVSLERLRKFLHRSNDVNALIRIESEIAQREADLASLQEQQDYLKDQTSLATLSVTLQRPPEKPPVDTHEAGGFLAGLSGGWKALTGVLVVGMTVIGAVLPFALVAAVVGVPLALALRSSRRRRPAAAPPAAPTTPA
jgi:hypothetical protein